MLWKNQNNENQSDERRRRENYIRSVTNLCAVIGCIHAHLAMLLLLHVMLSEAPLRSEAPLTTDAVNANVKFSLPCDAMIGIRKRFVFIC